MHGNFRSKIALLALLLAITISVLGTPTAAQAPAPARPQMRFCYICQLSGICQQALYGVPYFASRFNSIDWSIKLVGKNGNEVARDAVDAVLSTDASDCDVFLGPGSSSYSIALRGVIAKPWVDFASTSTELSNKALHPYFSRIIPTDDVGARGMLSIMDQYNWKSAYLLCSDESYGRSLSTAMERGITARGGTFKTVCVPSDADRATMAAVARGIRDSQYRVVAVLMAGWVDAFVNLLAEAEAYSMNRTNVFIFGESICSGYGSLPTNIHGSFCVSFGYNYDSYLAFYGSILAQNATRFKSDVENIGLTFDPLAPVADVTYQAYVYDAFSVDAFLHVMSTLHDAQIAGNFDKANVTNTVQLLRRRNSTGMTGLVALDTNGDRPASLMDLASVTPSGIKTFGSWSIDGGFFHNTSQLAVIYVPLGRESDIVADGDAVTASEQTRLILAIVIPVAVVLLFAAAFTAFLVTSTNAARFAPKDSEKPFAMMVLDMQKSTALWDRHPEEMRDVIKAYNQVIRNVLREHPVFESNTQGDSFTVVAKEVDPLITAAIEIQKQLYSTHWPGNGVVDEFYRRYADDEAQSATDTTDTASVSSSNLGRHTSNYFSSWNGPRARCVIHFGMGSISEVSGTLDYSGDIVSHCRDLEAVTHGGQVVISRAALDEASEAHIRLAKLYTAVATDDGQTMDAYSLSVPGLEMRVFRLRVAKGKAPVAIAVSPAPSPFGSPSGGNPLRGLSALSHHSPSSTTPPAEMPIQTNATQTFEDEHLESVNSGDLVA